MTSIALPLRVGANAQLVRANATDALMQVIQVMAQTTPDTWPHAKWFGLLTLWEGANPQVEEHPVLVDALNTALRNLGISWATVTSVRSTLADGSGSRAFDISLRTDDGGAAHGRVVA